MEESSKEKGLIDSLSGEEFDSKLLKLRPEWEKREMEARSTSKPEFVHYFDVYVCTSAGSPWRRVLL